MTGASRGIGKAIALELADAGCDLLLTARDQDALGESSRTRSARTAASAEIHAADLRGEGEPARLAEPRRRSASAGSTSWSTTPAPPGAAISSR